MKLSIRLNHGCRCRSVCLSALFCVSILIGVSGISAGGTVDISELPTLPPAFGARVTAPVAIEAAKVAAFQPLPTMKSRAQRHDVVQARATAGMKPGQASAGALLDISPVPAVEPIVKPPLPESKGLKKPVLPELKPMPRKSKTPGPGEKAR